MDALTKKTRTLKLNEPDDYTASETSHYYATRKESGKVNFARLEKGLLLCIYAYETAKSSLAPEMALWDHRLCVNTIKDGQCTKACYREHQTTYRQKNLCAYWYMKDTTCDHGTKCRNSHRFDDVPKYHRYIRTETDADVFRLLRFVRNFAGHYIDSVIVEQQELYKDIAIVMVHLVHYLSRKHSSSIEHLNLFLEKTTIDQLVPQENLLVELQKSYDVPVVFFELSMDFNSAWYRSAGSKRCVDFNRLSPDFVEHFNGIFTSYYEGRLKSRGAKAAW